MATHSSTVASRTPWTVWKGKKIWYQKMNPPRSEGVQYSTGEEQRAITNRNHSDYVLCRQRWKISIQSVKTRPGSDCCSNHELLIAKFSHKLKKRENHRAFQVWPKSNLLYSGDDEWSQGIRSGQQSTWRTTVRDSWHCMVWSLPYNAKPCQRKCKKAKWLSEEAYK